ncbi:hypothetical protein TWF281_002438 [Arthrobotrys megalospora]
MTPNTQVSILRTVILGILYESLFTCAVASVSYTLWSYRFGTRTVVGSELVAFEKRRVGSYRRRTEGKGSWVVLPVKYEYTVLGGLDNNLYTEVFFGDDRHPLKLAVTVQQVTWVPQLPTSRTAFCNNATNTNSCKIAGVSGYYRPPANVSQDDIFRLQDRSDYTASGYWTEDTLSTGTTSISFQFGVATHWQNLVPSLGLGIYPFNRSPNHPSFLDALLQQGKIAGQYISCYDISNHERSGEMVIGGVDRDKYQGKLKILKGGDYPGMVGSPEVMVATGRNASFGIGEVAKWTLLTPDTRFLWLPQPVVYNIISILPVATYDLRPGDSFPVYTVPCNTKFEPSWVIEFTFEGVKIIIPFSHLITPIEVPNRPSNVSRCVLAVQPNDGRYSLPGYTFSYILGAPFWRSAYVVVNSQENITAIAVPKANVVSQSIVELGGLFGTDIEGIEGSSGGPSVSNTPVPNSPLHEKNKNLGAIIGASIAGAAVFLLVCLGLFIYRRKRRSRRQVCSPSDWARMELDGGEISTAEVDWRLLDGVKRRRSEEVPLERRGELSTGREEAHELPGSMRRMYTDIGIAS